MTSTPPVAKPIRSPSYPSLSLSDAIASVRKIESQYRLGPVDRVAGAKLIGYSGLSGPANQALASLAQYGLVERAGKGEMRVTERGRAILHPDSDEEKRLGLKTAALEPQLFRELHERWPNMIPPEEGVINYLNRQGFNKSAIRPAAKAYLQTLLFLQESGASESHGLPDDNGQESAPNMEVDVKMSPLATNPMSLPAQPNPVVVQAALNQVNMNIQADIVHLSATLDYDGLKILQKKIEGLMSIMGPD
jgi:hypothetical protein